MSLLFVANSADANWNANWLNTAGVHWQSQPPKENDDIGVSVYCGFAGFSGRTRVMLSLQNRTSHVVTLETDRLMSPSNEEIKKVELMMPAFRGRLSGLLLRSKVSLKKDYQQAIERDLTCRLLEAKKQQLPDFQPELGAGVCVKNKFDFSPGDQLDASFDFVVPHYQIKVFRMNIAGQNYSFSCGDSKP
jgi:hypothetical protein